MRARRKGAALARSLVVHEKIAKFFLDHRAAKANAKNVLLHRRTIKASPIQKEIIRIQHVIAEKLVCITMKCLGTGLENGIYVAAAIAPLAGIVERGLHLEFTNYIRIRQRNIGGLPNVVIGRTDSLDQVIIIIFALAIDNDAHIASSQLRGCIQFALCTR